MAIGDGLRAWTRLGRTSGAGLASEVQTTPRSSLPGSRPRRYDAIPLAIQYKTRTEEPVYRRPPPPPRPTRPEQIRPLLSGLLARQEQDHYNNANLSMLEYQRQRFAALQAKNAEIDAAIRSKKIEDQSHQDYQDLHADAIMQTLRPAKASAAYGQAVAFRMGANADLDISQIDDMAREAEGKARFRRYMEWYNNATPEEQQTQAGLQLALLKEDMDAELYEDILTAAKRSDDSVYRYSREDRRAANRILQTTFADRVPGYEGQATDAEISPRIPTAEKPEEEDVAAERAEVVAKFGTDALPAYDYLRAGGGADFQTPNQTSPRSHTNALSLLTETLTGGSARAGPGLTGGLPLGPLTPEGIGTTGPLSLKEIGVGLLQPLIKTPTEEDLSFLGPASGPTSRSLAGLATLPALASAGVLGPAPILAGEAVAIGLGTAGEAAGLPTPLQYGLEIGAGVFPGTLTVVGSDLLRTTAARAGVTVPELTLRQIGENVVSLRRSANPAIREFAFSAKNRLRSLALGEEGTFGGKPRGISPIPEQLPPQLTDAELFNRGLQRVDTWDQAAQAYFVTPDGKMVFNPSEYNDHFNLLRDLGYHDAPYRLGLTDKFDLKVYDAALKQAVDDGYTRVWRAIKIENGQQVTSALNIQARSPTEFEQTFSQLAAKEKPNTELYYEFGSGDAIEGGSSTIGKMSNQIQQGVAKSTIATGTPTTLGVEGEGLADLLADIKRPLGRVKGAVREAIVGGEEGAIGGREAIDRKRILDKARQIAAKDRQDFDALPPLRQQDYFGLARESLVTPSTPAGGRLKNGTPVARKSAPNTPLGTIKSSVKGTKNVWVETPEGRSVKISRDKLAASQPTPEGAPPVAPPLEQQVADALQRQIEAESQFGEIPPTKPPKPPRKTAAGGPPEEPPPPSSAAEQLDFTIHRVRFKPGQDAFERLASLVRSSKRLSAEKRALQTERLGTKISAARRQATKALEAGAPDSEVSRAIKGVLKGRNAEPLLEPMWDSFDDAERMAMRDALVEAYPFTSRNGVLNFQNALDARDALLDGYVLAPHQVKLLDPILPQDALQKLLIKSRGFWGSLGREALELANVFRILQTPGDLSILLRQLFLMPIMHPVEWTRTARRQLPIFFSEKYSRELAQAAMRRPNYDVLKNKYRLAVEALEEASGAAGVIEERLTVGSDSFIGRQVEKTPGIKPSQRAYGLGLALFRLDVADTAYMGMKAAGASDKEITDWVTVFNAATGRGKLPFGLERQGGALAQLMYAPRLVAARVQVPWTAAFGSSYARRYAIRSIASGAALAGGILMLAKAAGADVEVDPRSSDWGKLKIGPTRVDVTGGYGPYIRIATRVGAQVLKEAGVPGIEGGYKNPLGEVSDLDINTFIESFAESKLAPGPALVKDIWQGKTFTGERLNLRDLSDPDVLRREAMNRLTPLVVQSLVDAVRSGHLSGIPLATGEFVGLSSQTYTPTTVKIADAIGDDIQAGLIDVDEYPELEGRAPRTRSELHPKNAFDFAERHQGLLEEIAESFETEEPTAQTAAFEQAKLISSESAQKLQTLASQAASGEIDYKQFREGLKTIQTTSRDQREIVSNLLEAAGQDVEERPKVAGIIRDLYDYGQVFEKFPNADIDPAQKDALFDAIATFRAALGPKREARLEANMNLAFKEVPLYVEYKSDNKIIRDSGYFERQDEAWDLTRERAADQGVTLPATRDAWERQIRQDAISRYGSVEGERRGKSDKWTRMADNYSERSLHFWRRENPDALALVIKWGYKEISGDDAAILRRAGYGSSNIPSSSPTYESDETSDRVIPQDRILPRTLEVELTE